MSSAFENRYSMVDRALHRIAFRTAPIQVDLTDLEERLFAGDFEGVEVERPVFVTGLPRAGTTLLLELLVESGAFASHTYRDVPFVLVPLLWNRFSGRFRNGGEEQERAHGDGMTVVPDSPEAFEEIVWKAHWKERYRDDRIVPWDETRKPAFDRFLARHIRKIVGLRGGAVESRLRYVSKNNLNIARVPYLLTLFDDARVVVPFRHPVEQAAPLLRQHENFLAIHATTRSPASTWRGSATTTSARDSSPWTSGGGSTPPGGTRPGWASGSSTGPPPTGTSSTAPAPACCSSRTTACAGIRARAFGRSPRGPEWTTPASTRSWPGPAASAPRATGTSTPRGPRRACWTRPQRSTRSCARPPVSRPARPGRSPSSPRLVRWPLGRLPVARRMLLRDGMRTLVTVLGVGVAVALPLLLFSVWEGAHSEGNAWVASRPADAWVLHANSRNLVRSVSYLPEGLGNGLPTVPGVQRVAPLLRVIASTAIRGEQATFFVLGIRPGDSLTRPVVEEGSPDPAPGELLLDRALARKYGLGVGDSLRIHRMAFRVGGLTSGTQAVVTQFGFATLADAQRPLGYEGVVRPILRHLRIPEHPPPVSPARGPPQTELLAVDPPSPGTRAAIRPPAATPSTRASPETTGPAPREPTPRVPGAGRRLHAHRPSTYGADAPAHPTAAPSRTSSRHDRKGRTTSLAPREPTLPHSLHPGPTPVGFPIRSTDLREAGFAVR